ncbi:hypothetical protein N0V93_002178 [Gnomoniopsis smithogilvyi]|uniref:CFEM domain-containing protein n=1 Tax=Gnomoniopsis smithogilvyi TaxID=1191159 RepID=A0A9W8YUB1_9PEZI|nr:hypothetical protein N0V93_002178 [Gnomoniopsis smithogilvyi]
MLDPRSVNLTEVPSCGVSCLAAGLYHTTCSLLNQTCLCVDQSYNDWVTSCVESNCTIKNQLRTQRATNLGCGVTPVIEGAENFMLPEVIVFVASTLFFVLRLANRATRMAPWGWDDTTISISWLSCACFLGVGIVEVKLDAGSPLWDKEFWQIDAALEVFFISEVLYTITLAMIKSSILFLYTRIFPTGRFRRFVWGTQIFNVMLVLGFVPVDFMQCQPLSYFWHSWDGESVGTCIDLNAFAYAHSGVNIALDVWIIGLPVHEIWKLNMSLRWKLQAIAMFAVGIFLTAASCVRLTTLADFYKDPSDISTYFPISIWTVVELNVGVVAACMPAARLFVAKKASDIAKSAGFTRFSESARPSYNNSRRSSYIKRQSARAAAAARMHDSLPSYVGEHDFGDEEGAYIKGPEHQLDCEMQRPGEESHMEMVDVESRIVKVKETE